MKNRYKGKQVTEKDGRYQIVKTIRQKHNNRSEKERERETGRDEKRERRLSPVAPGNWLLTWD